MRPPIEFDQEMQKALKRYEVVSHYLAKNPGRGQKRATLKQLASQTWQWADGSTFKPSEETIRSWVRLFRKRGLEGLKDKPRPQRGMQNLSPEQCEKLCELKREVPERSIDRMIKIAEETQKFEFGLLTRSTVHRVLKAHGLSKRALTTPDKQDLDRFEADYPNDLWQSDMLAGPWLPDPLRPGKMKRAALFAFLDDHSRLLLHGRFNFRENLPYLELVFRRSLQKWGVPRRVYYDNGQVYRSIHMQQIVAHLGIYRIVHTKPYRPEGHGKIEALNRLMTSAFIAEVKASHITTIDELNEAFNAWMTEEYNNRIHGETKQMPLERWKNGSDHIQLADDERIRQAFLWKENRTADKTGLFSLLGVKYQTPPSFSRRKIEIRFDPEALHQVELWHNNHFIERLSPFSVSTHRRAKEVPPLPQPMAPKEKTDWLGHLVKKHRKSGAVEPSIEELALRHEQEQTDHIESLISLFDGRLAPESLDLEAIRNHVETYGPINSDNAEAILDGMIESLGNDRHVSVYLEVLRHLPKGGRR